MKGTRLLLVARGYPPMVGGMEKYAADLSASLSEVLDVHLVANRSGRAMLPLFALRAFVHLLLHGRRYTHIHFCDAVLAPLAAFARLASRAKVSVTVHGLDIVYPQRLYRLVVPACLRRAHAIVCVSRHTLELCVQAGIPRSRCTRITNGLRLAGLPAAAGRRPRGGGRVMLLTVTRLVRRKGIAWFAGEVMPRLPGNHVWYVAGDGPERARIEREVASRGLADRVRLLGAITEEEKARLLGDADLYVMPNVPVEGDAEGFGISVLEAGASGVPVIASRLEGITDAVIEGETGKLVEAGDAAAFAAAILDASFDAAAVQQSVRNHFDWEKLRDEYLALFCQP